MQQDQIQAPPTALARRPEIPSPVSRAAWSGRSCRARETGAGGDGSPPGAFAATLHSAARPPRRPRLWRASGLLLVRRGPFPDLHRRRLCRRRHGDHRGEGFRSRDRGRRRPKPGGARRRSLGANRRWRLQADGRCGQGQGRHAGRDDRANRPTGRSAKGCHRPGRGADRLGQRAKAERRGRSATIVARIRAFAKARLGRTSAPSNGWSRQRRTALAWLRPLPRPSRSRLPRKPRSPAPRRISTCCRRRSSRRSAPAPNWSIPRRRPSATSRSPRFARRSTASSATARSNSGNTRSRACGCSRWWRWTASMSTPISRKRNSARSIPVRRSTSRWTPMAGGSSRAWSSRSRRPPARSSRCCRRTTRPAISPRSCSGSRFGSKLSPEAIQEGGLRPGLSVVASVRTRDESQPKPTLLGALGFGVEAKEGAKP